MYKGHKWFSRQRFRLRWVGAPVLVTVLALAGCQTAVPPPSPEVSFVTEKPAISIPTMTVGVAISSVTLPAAVGGSGELTYDLKPSVPGLKFTAATRVLSGTPTAVGSYSMTYTATDAEEEDADEEDTASLKFTITVQAAPPPPTTDPAPMSADVASGSYLTAVLGGDANDALTMAGAAALSAVLTDDQVAALLTADWWKSPGANPFCGRWQKGPPSRWHDGPRLGGQTWIRNWWLTSLSMSSSAAATASSKSIAQLRC